MMKPAQFPMAFDEIPELGDQTVRSLSFLLAYGDVPVLDIDGMVSIHFTGELNKKQRKLVDRFVKKWTKIIKVNANISCVFLSDEDEYIHFHLSFWTHAPNVVVNFKTWDKMDSIVRTQYRAIIEAGQELAEEVNLIEE